MSHLNTPGELQRQGRLKYGGHFQVEIATPLMIGQGAKYDMGHFVDL